jgi:hypothetical protein
VFADIRQWREWNPVCTECRFETGKAMQAGACISFTLKPMFVPIRIAPVVDVMEQGRKVVWSGGRFGIHAEHTFIFKQTAVPSVIIDSTEVFSGLMLWPARMLGLAGAASCAFHSPAGGHQDRSGIAFSGTRKSAVNGPGRNIRSACCQNRLKSTMKISSVMHPQIHIACFVSSHGFGHAARASAVMNAIYEQWPYVYFEIFTETPEWFFRQSLQAPFACHQVKTDVGLVQTSALRFDLNKTIAALDAFFCPSRINCWMNWRKSFIKETASSSSPIFPP